MKSIEKQREMKSPEEWLQISTSFINSQLGSELLNKYGGLYGILKLLHPNLSWRTLERSARQEKKTQLLLCNYLSSIFKNLPLQ